MKMILLILMFMMVLIVVPLIASDLTEPIPTPLKVTNIESVSIPKNYCKPYNDALKSSGTINLQISGLEILASIDLIKNDTILYPINKSASLYSTITANNLVCSGDIEITYDGSQRKKLFLPDFSASSPSIIGVFYFDSDGSSYYDAKLTDVAKLAIQEPKEIIKETYTYNTKDTLYSDNTANAIIYSGMRYANSSGTTIEEAYSLKDCEFCDRINLLIQHTEIKEVCEGEEKEQKCYNETVYVDGADSKYPLTIDDIIDYNYTTIRLNVGLASSELNKDVPIEVYSKNNISINYYQDIINLKSVDERQTLILPFGTDKMIQLGNRTTIIQLSDSNNSADIYYCDTHATCDSGDNVGIQVKWDISNIQAGATVLDATAYLCFNNENGAFDDDTTFWRITDQTWTEASVAATLDGQTKTNESTDGAFDIDPFGNCDSYFNFTDGFIVDYEASNSYTTIRIEDTDYIVGTIVGSSDEEAWYVLVAGDLGVVDGRFQDREGTFRANPFSGPTLNITYSMPPSYSLTIISPTETSPRTIANGDKVNITFGFTEDGDNFTTLTNDNFLNVTLNASDGTETIVNFLTQEGNICTGTLDCTQHETEDNCENCSQCDWTSTGSEETDIIYEDFDSSAGHNGADEWDLNGWSEYSSSTYCLNDANDDCIISTTSDTMTTYGSNLDLSNCDAGTIWISGYFYDYGCDSGEWLHLFASDDGGSGYDDIYTISTGLTPNGWWNTSVDDGYAVSNFRLGFKTYSTDFNEYYFVDDVTVHCLNEGYECSSIVGGSCSNCQYENDCENCSGCSQDTGTVKACGLVSGTTYYECNWTAPDLSSGDYDIKINITHDSKLYNDSETNAIIYGISALCSGSADCHVNCADNEHISDTLDVGGYDLYLEGTGTFYIEADIMNLKAWYIGDTCEIYWMENTALYVMQE